MENQQTGTCLWIDYPVTSGTPLALASCSMDGPFGSSPNHLFFKTNLAPPGTVELRSNLWGNLCVDGSDGVTARLAECDPEVLSQQWAIG